MPKMYSSEDLEKFYFDYKTEWMLEKTDHLICMAHARVKFEKVYQHGGDAVAKEFGDMISELYDLENVYGMRVLIAEDIGTERQGDHIEDIVRRIIKRLDEKLRKAN